MKCLNNRLLLFVFASFSQSTFSFLPGISKIAGLDFSNQDSSVGPSLFDGSVEYQQKKFEELSKELVAFDVQKSNDINRLDATKKQLEALVSKKDVEGGFLKNEELLKKRNNLLNERLQLLTSRAELWKSFEKAYKEHLEHFEKGLEKLKESSLKNSIGVRVTLKELRETEEAMASQSEGQNLIFAKIKNFKQQEQAEQDNLAAIKKELELRKKEKSTLDDELGEQGSSYASGAKIDFLNSKIVVAAYDQDHLEEKISLSELKIRQLKFKTSSFESERFLKNMYHKKLVDTVEQIKSVLRVDASDVRNAKDAWKEQEKITGLKKEEIRKENDEKRHSRTGLEVELIKLKSRLEGLQTVSSRDLGEEAVLDAKIWNIKRRIEVLDRELDLNELKLSIAKIEEDKKHGEHRALEVRYQLRRGMEPEKLLSRYLEEIQSVSAQLYTARDITKNDSREAVNFIAKRNNESNDAKKRIEELTAKKDEIFTGNNGKFREAISLLEVVQDSQKESTLNGNFLSLATELETKQTKLLTQLRLLKNEFISKRREVDIWKRSPRALSAEHALEALRAGEIFVISLFWGTPKHLSPMALIGYTKSISWNWIFGFLIFLFLFLVSFLVVRRLLKKLRQKVTSQTAVQHSRTGLLYILLLSATVDFVSEYFSYLFLWSFLNFAISINLGVLGFSIAAIPSYFIALFYLASIPLFIILSMRLLADVGVLNQRLSYFFFNEKSQGKATRLLSTILFSGSIILPLRKAFMFFGPVGSHLPSVLLGAFSLIVPVALILFINKEDLLGFIPQKGWVFVHLKSWVEAYYYPVFGFIIALSIISNPYIGYSNLAYYLAFVVPATAAVAIGVFKIHDYLREHSLSFFIKEEEGGAADRFEHAKMLYGFFIILTFLAFILAGFLLLSRMWELPYTLKQLWQALSHEWVFDVGEVGAGKSFGVVQVLTFSMFFGSGFIVSSVVNKVLLDKLFDVFRVDPGAQNTFFLIIKYLTIIFFTMMGLMAVNLSSYISASLAMLGIAVSLGAKDQISDIFSGLLILLERQIEIGHFIKTGTTLGTVHIISLRSTTIRTARNFFVSIPNRLMISQSIENWGAGRVAVGMVMKIRVAYGSDPELVKNLISDALNNHPLVLRVPAAVLRLDDLADSGLEFFVRFFITARKAREVWNVASDIRIALLSSFKEHNIEVPFPQHVVHFAGAKKDEGGGNFNIKIDGVAPSDSNQM